MELFSLQLTEPTSFLTQCHVWEVSALNQPKHRKAGSIGFWEHVISKICIGSTGNRWSSSGKNAQNSLRWEFSTRAIQRKDHLHVNVQWHWLGKTRKQENCIANALRVTEYARRFTQGHWSILGPGSEKKWYGTYVNKLDGEFESEAWITFLAKGGGPKKRFQQYLKPNSSTHFLYFRAIQTWCRFFFWKKSVMTVMNAVLICSN